MDRIKSIILEKIREYDIDERIIRLLGYPERVIEVSIPIKRQNGDISIYVGYRVVYSTLLGPGKGGIRFHPNVTKEEVEMLAFWMTIKNSLANIPYGGAKGGIVINPGELSNYELEALSREYIRRIYEFLGIDRDIPAPDVYTNDKIMAIMLDEYEKISRKSEPGMITGKPTVLGGDPIRKYSTSLGGLYVLEQIRELYDLKNEKRMVIHGFGNVGQYFAKFAYENGYKIIAVSDSKGGIYNPQGIDIKKLIEIKQKTGSVINYKDSKVIDRDDILYIDSDILVPASIENIINKSNVDKISTKIVLELANGPIDMSVEDKLLKNDIIVVPDVLANSGGVIVSYFEWVQNRSGLYWSKEHTENKLKEKITSNTKKVYEISKKLGADLRTAAYYVAVKRLEEAMKYRLFL